MWEEKYLSKLYMCVIVLLLILVVPAIFGVVQFGIVQGQIEQTKDRLVDLATDRDTDTEHIRTNLVSAQVVRNVDYDEIRAQMQKMRSLTAFPSDIVGGSKRLAVVFLDFDQPKGWYQPVKVDIAELDDSAVVFVTNHSVKLEMAGVTPLHRAKVAVQSPLPFDVTGNHSRLLAGFKVQLGDVDYLKGESKLRFRRGNMCGALKRWSEYFGIDWRRARAYGYIVKEDNQPIHIRASSVLTNTSSNGLKGLQPINLRCVGS